MRTENFHKLLPGASHQKTPPHTPQFHRKTFTNNHKTSKFTKVFSLKSFITATLVSWAEWAWQVILYQCYSSQHSSFLKVHCEYSYFPNTHAQGFYSTRTTPEEQGSSPVWHEYVHIKAKLINRSCRCNSVAVIHVDHAFLLGGYSYLREIHTYHALVRCLLKC